MKNLCYRVAAWAVVVSALLSEVAQAQDEPKSQTMAIVALSGYDAIIADLAFIGKLVEQPGLPQMAEGGLAVVTGGRGLAGVDKSKPWGAVVQAKGTEFEPLIFIPVEDLNAIMTTVGAAMGSKPAPNDEGIYTIPLGLMSLFVKEQEGWAYLARNADMLAELPADPTEQLDGLQKDYDIGVRLFVQHIDPAYRQIAIQQMKQALESGIERLPEESDEDFEMRKRLALNSMKQMEMFFNETDHVTVGWHIDSEQQATHLDMTIVAVEGTRMAAQVEQLANTKTEHAGFLLPEAALTMNFTSQAGSPEDVQQAVDMIEGVRKQAMKAIDEDSDLPDDATREAVKSALGDLIDVGIATIKEGKFDGGAAARLEPEALTFVAGGHVASGPDLEQAFKKVVALIEKEADEAEIKWDVDEHEGVRFHQLTIANEDEDAQKLLGEKLNVVLGIGEKSFFVSVGRNALETLIEVLDDSKEAGAKKVPPMQMVVSIGKLLAFAASLDDNPALAAAAEAAASAEGNDHLRVTVTPVELGAKYRFQIEQGVLKAIGAAAARQNQ